MKSSRHHGGIMTVALYGNSSYDQFKAALADAKGSAVKMSELLIRCSQIGKQQWVEDLVAAGANVNCKTKVRLRTPSSMTLDRFAFARPRIQSFPEARDFTQEGSTPLHIAAAANRGGVTETLLQNGANVNVKVFLPRARPRAAFASSSARLRSRCASAGLTRLHGTRLCRGRERDSCCWHPPRRPQGTSALATRRLDSAAHWNSTPATSAPGPRILKNS